MPEDGQGRPISRNKPPYGRRVVIGGGGKSVAKRRRGVIRLKDGTVDFAVHDAEQWEQVKKIVAKHAAGVIELIPELASAMKYHLYLIDFTSQREWIESAFSVTDRHARRIVNAARQLAAIESDDDPRHGWPERHLRELGKLDTARDRELVSGGLARADGKPPRVDQIRDAVERIQGVKENDISRRNAHDLLDELDKRIDHAAEITTERIRDQGIRGPFAKLLGELTGTVQKFRESTLHR